MNWSKDLDASELPLNRVLGLAMKQGQGQGKDGRRKEKDGKKEKGQGRKDRGTNGDTQINKLEMKREE